MLDSLFIVRNYVAFLSLTLGLPLAFTAAEIPQAEISSGTVRATIYLPDAQNGYYRATRFDWSGVVASLESGGHSYFGKWFDRYDPKVHESVMGPVEEFLTNEAGLGYQEAPPGGTFVKIGVGALRKPQESGFRQFSTYDIVDAGKWIVHRGPDWIEFVHELAGTNGYAYLYRKRLSLAKDRPELAIEHSLKNTGRKTIETSVYEHNFFMLDSQPTGPDFVVRFPFSPHTAGGLAGLAETRGKEIVFVREMAKGQSVHADLEGYGATTADYDIRVENRKTGAGVRQRCDRPMTKLVLWSIRSTVCPEAYIDLRIAPGQESTWRISYEFYTVSNSLKE